MEKKPSSGYRIRFSDCDLFGHLNNARYIDYFLNAREDHLREHYQLTLDHYYKQHELSWFVSSHEIVYLKPAQYNEYVLIESSLIKAAENYLLVELVMKDESSQQVKSVMWTRFVPVNVKTGRRQNHPEVFNSFTRQVEVSDVNVAAGIKSRIDELRKVDKLIS